MIRSLCTAFLASLFCAHALANPKLVIVDDDFYGPATTNLQAALLFLNSPAVRVLGFTVVTGDGWRDENVVHTLRLLEIDKHTDIPVVPGAAFPLINTPERTAAWERMYGHYSYKGAYEEQTKDSPLVGYHAHGPFVVPPPLEGSPHLRPSNEIAANFLIEQVRKYPHQVSIYAGGPLTNIALAIKLDPEFASLAKEFVFMGAVFNPDVVGDDRSQAIELAPMVNPDFNIVFDPEAAHIVLHAPWPKITAVGDVTNRIVMNKELLGRITSVKTPITEYLGKYTQLDIPIWDEMAAAVLIDPSLATHHQTFYADVDIDHGAGYGVVRIYPDGKNPGIGEQKVDVITDVDAPRLTDFFVKAMQKPVGNK
jgi:inosine-uridine nucleoside N-ribohydrolase